MVPIYKESGLEMEFLSNDPDEIKKDIELIKKLKRDSGPKGSREFLKKLGDWILEGNQLNEDLTYYLGNALIDISENKSVRDAFNMPGKGRPRDKEKIIRDYRIAIRIAKMMKSGESFEESAFQISKDFNVSDHTAEKAYKKHSRLMNKIADHEKLEKQFDDMLKHDNPDQHDRWLYSPVCTENMDN
jgi:hypothetical protein